MVIKPGRFLLPTVLLAVLFTSRQPCRAEDLSSRFGVSGNLGAAWALAPDYVTETADSTGLETGGMISFDMGPHVGAALAYDHLAMGNGLSVAPLNLLFRFRFSPEKQWNPIFEFGPGSAKGVNSPRLENLSFKAAFGVDYFPNSDWSIGPQLSYFFISHSGAASTYAHLVTLGVRASFYFKRTT